MTKLTAKRTDDGYDLFAGEMLVPFGKAAHFASLFVFDTDDERLAGYVTTDALPLRDLLADVRKGHDAYYAEIDAEMEADAATEQAVERYHEQATGDHYAELQADLAAYDAQFPNGYCA